MAAMNDEAPRVLGGGRYAVVRVLGEGAQATTYEAVDKRDGRLVAVKCFRVRGAASWKEVELAEREAKVLASLSHPNLPSYVEHFESGGELFLVTEKIEGESLQARKARGASLSEAEVMRLLRDAEEALRYLHGRAPPIIHRDLKPSNILARPDGSFAFIDFGSVRDRLKPAGGSTVVGTFGFMAPEQFQGRALPASDVYAIGATALSMLTGSEPEDLPHKGLGIDVAAALRGARVSPGLIKALSRMLDPDPDRRATSVGDCLADLERGRARSGPESRPDRGRSRDERRRAREEDAGAREARKEARREERRERKQAERDARHEAHERAHERRHALRLARRTHRPGVPPVVRALLILGLSIGQIAVAIALTMVVPALFALLAPLFGPGLRKAGQAVYEAGRRAMEATRAARAAVRTWDGGAISEAERRAMEESIRVRFAEQEGGARVRVGDARPGASDDELDAEARAEEEAAEAERRGHEARRSR